MNFTLLGGVREVTSKLKSNFNKLRKYLTRERLAAFSMLSKMIGLVLMLSVFPVGTMHINAKDSEPDKEVYKSELRLNVQQSVPVALDNDKPEIKIGESNYQSKIREEAEARERQSRQSQSRDIVAREISRDYQADASFSEKRALAKQAAEAYGVDWKLVEAVWEVESGKSWDTGVRSYAGAQGPMQFMPGTWRSVGVDANGDGVADANNAQDAVYSGAKYLAMGGAASGDIDSALYSYNHAGWYVEKVKRVMNSITE